jgi:DNA-binding transcriptional regulator YbjK
MCGTIVNMAGNPARRAALADAGLVVLGNEGARGLTHRAVDRQAGVAIGTTSNYFPTRDTLLGALGDRIYERLAPDGDPLESAEPDHGAMVGYVRDIWRRLLANRELTLALLELRLEASRRPALAKSMRETLERNFRSDVEFNRLRQLPGDAREILLLHLAMDGLVLDQLTASIGLDPSDVDEVLVDLVHRLVPGDDGTTSAGPER